jgi:Leucine-rich repeat (LRR) protein
VSGFSESLEQLDLQSNLLRELPNSLMSLAVLTVLNLSYNKFTGGIPLQLLALDRLVTLDLSHCALTSLWPKSDWKGALEALKEQDAEDSGDVSFNTSGGSDFWAAFPSAAPKSTKQPLPQTHTPFPCLKSLNLSHNAFKNAALEVDLPSFLTHLNLSANRLSAPLSPSIFQSLAHLVSLTLSSNALDDTVFSPVSQQPFLPALKDLDISGNSIDSLESVEETFGERPFFWSGLPKVIQTVVGAQQVGGLNVTVQGNHLRNELHRRRALARQARPRPAARSAAVKAGTEPGDLADQVATLSVQPGTPRTEDIRSEPRVAVAQDGSVTLAGQGLKELACDPAVAPTLLDASKNQLPNLPLEIITTAGWSATLCSLNLSRNRIADLPTSLGGFTLARLEDLNLSGNAIKSEEALSTIAAFAPVLKTLDLTYNYLASVQGIERLLLRPLGGLKVLQLGGNKIEDLQPLVDVAAQIQSEADAMATFQCREISVADNSINKLDPLLGFLPLELFAVGGESSSLWRAGIDGLQATHFAFPRAGFMKRAARRDCSSICGSELGDLGWFGLWTNYALHLPLKWRSITVRGNCETGECKRHCRQSRYRRTRNPLQWPTGTKDQLCWHCSESQGRKCLNAYFFLKKLCIDIC